MKKKTYLSLDPARKVIVIDDTVTPTPTEEKLLNSYILAGWNVRIKSQMRAKVMRERHKKASLLDGDMIEDALKNDPVGLAKYTDKLKTKGFFGARSWYLGYIGAKKEDPVMDQEPIKEEAPAKKRKGRPKKKDMTPEGEDQTVDQDPDQAQEEL